MLFNSFF